MKKLLKEFSIYEKMFNIDKDIKNLYSEIKENKKINKHIIKECSSDSRNGKTFIFILNSGLIELHEILNKNVIYLHLTVRVKKEFEKIKKELETIND